MSTTTKITLGTLDESLGIESFSGTHAYRPQCAVTAVELDWYAGVFPPDELRRLAVAHANHATDALAEGQCPRCGDPLDPHDTAGSRVTTCRCIPICPACGLDEGHQMILGKRYSAVWEWPIAKGWRTRRTEKIMPNWAPSRPESSAME